MSAPSDGARADARKRLAVAAAVAPDERIVRALGQHVFYRGCMTVEGWQKPTCLCGHTYDDNPNASDAWSHPRHVAVELAGVIADAKAEAWDERDRARPTYPDPHPEDCAGWEDCWCASYPNPYRDVTS